MTKQDDRPYPEKVREYRRDEIAARSRGLVEQARELLDEAPLALQDPLREYLDCLREARDANRAAEIAWNDYIKARNA